MGYFDDNFEEICEQMVQEELECEAEEEAQFREDEEADAQDDAEQENDDDDDDDYCRTRDCAPQRNVRISLRMS